MKTIKQLSLIGLIAVLLITSCSTEKQINFQNDWSVAKHNGHNGQYKNCSICKPEDKFHQSKTNTEIAIDHKSTNMSVMEENAVVIKIDNQELVASVDNNVLIPIKDKEDAFFTLQTISDNYESNPSLTDNLKNKLVTKLIDGEPKVEGLGLAGFIISIVGWFMPLVLGFLMCIVAIIFGAISLGKIRRNPNKFKGRGFAITSLILGILGVLGIALLLALLMI